MKTAVQMPAILVGFAAALPFAFASALPYQCQIARSAADTNILNQLFPVSQTNSWTTAPEASDPMPLSDATLKPFKVLKALSHNYTDAPDGTLSMQAYYPNGSYNFDHSPQGGFSFYATGPSQFNLTTAKEATFGYRVFFQEGFEYNKGGKLPGLYGGDSYDEAVSCSGGRRDDGCFSSRLMWRTDGMGELYTYLPPDYTANQAVCDQPPFSTCNDVYGASVGRGSFNFTAGQWNTVSQRVRLNDAGAENGELELYAGGVSVVNVSGLVLRDSDDGRIWGMQFQTFFGGSDASWASQQSQYTYFDDFSIAITELL
ncbi:hypothetical protein B0H21DRAFT_32692 [Amylocystis lapponica]|nr:hypothetical protein B0H21DRAFT_32692 [Amylocystis lapponica]